MFNWKHVQEHLKFYTNIGWAILDSVLTSAISLGVTLIVARHFGSQSFGEFSIVVTILLVFDRMCTVGIRPSVLRRGSQDIENLPLWTYAGIYIVRRRCVVWIPILILFSFCLPQLFWIPIWFGAIGLLACHSEIFLVSFAAEMNTKASILPQRVSQIATAGFKFAVVFFELPLSFLLLAYSAGQILQLLLLQKAYKKPASHLDTKKIEIVAADRQTLFAQGLWRLAFSAAPQLVIGFVAISSAGDFAVAIRSIMAVSTVAALANTSFIPYVARGACFKKAVIFNLCVGLFCFIICATFSKTITLMFWGESFAGAILPLALLAICIPTLLIMPILETRLLLFMLDEEVRRNNVFGSTLGLFAVIVGSLLFGATGCAIGVVVGNMCIISLHATSTIQASRKVAVL